ncbi:zinc dependent phospholipase C family protein [Blautia sp. MSJ-19]|uniref:zinc dependent phospholipase C family protein n=1 Tax=Blautia sp. MSJ-19 TaxID=2841517 RepID=UPI002FE6D902
MSILRKKSHILLARYLADQMPANESLQSHRKAFCLGNILPDIQPSFVTRRHEYFGTFEDVQGKIRRLVRSGAEYNDRVFWRRAGEVMHYIADYFTFPHNKTFEGTLRQHNTYEKYLKNELKAFVLAGKADEYAVNQIHFETSNQLLEYIKEHHRRYLNRKRNIDDDIRYILSVCYQVFQGLFQLCGKANTAEHVMAV